MPSWSRRSWIGLVAALLVASCLSELVGGCGKEDAPAATGKATRKQPKTSLILLIGVDGLEWDLVLPLVAEEKLPNLAELMERGQYGQLRSFVPTYSPVLWTSIATGKRPEKHGITHFVYNDQYGRLRLFNNGDRRTKAIWNIVSDYGKRVCTIGWWMTYPAEEINGIMVAQTNTLNQVETAYGQNVWKGMLREGVPHQVYPPQREAEVMAALRDADAGLPTLTERIFGRFPHPLSVLGERLWNNCMWAFRADATYLRIALALARHEPPFDLTLVYFGGPDVAGHRFWRYMTPERYVHQPPDEQIENLGRVIEAYYAYIDSAIGQLAEAAGPQATVIVVSDHGMKAINLTARFDPDDPPWNVNSADHQDAPPGVFIAAGRRIRRSTTELPPAEWVNLPLETVGSVLDVTPTILTMMDLPVGRDMSGRAMDHLLRRRFRKPDGPVLVDTHDTAEFLANRPKTTSPAADEEERLRQLRSLGYIQDEAE